VVLNNDARNPQSMFLTPITSLKNERQHDHDEKRRLKLNVEHHDPTKKGILT